MPFIVKLSCVGLPFLIIGLVLLRAWLVKVSQVHNHITVAEEK